MKQIKVLFLLLFCITLMLTANRADVQNISNPNFAEPPCVTQICNHIANWVTSASFTNLRSSDTIAPITPNSKIDISSFSNRVAANSYPHPYLSLLTHPILFKEDGSFFESFVANGFGIGDDGYIDFSKGGEPFPYRPAKIKGSYRYGDTIPSIESFGKCAVLLKKYNTQLNKIDTIGYAESTTQLAETHDLESHNWATFEIPINYYSNQVPDSMVVVFFPSTNPTEFAGLSITDLSFEYTTTDLEEVVEPTNIIYPNPTTGFIDLSQFPNFKTYIIYDLNGKELKKGNYSSNILLDDLPNQIYTLLIEFEEGFTKTYKIVLGK